MSEISWKTLRILGRALMILFANSPQAILILWFIPENDLFDLPGLEPLHVLVTNGGSAVETKL